MSDAEYDAYCQQVQQEQYDEHARDTLRSIVHHLGPAECLRVIGDMTTIKPVSTGDEEPF